MGLWDRIKAAVIPDGPIVIELEEPARDERDEMIDGQRTEIAEYAREAEEIRRRIRASIRTFPGGR